MTANSWNIIFILVTFASHIIFLPYLAIYDASKMPTDNMVGVFNKLFQSGFSLGILLFAPLMCIFPDLCVKYLNVVCGPKHAERLTIASKY